MQLFRSRRRLTYWLIVQTSVIVALCTVGCVPQSTLGEIAMARWLARLSGEQFDIEEYPTWFPSGDVFAFWKDDRVYLTGPAFERAASGREFMAMASDALDRLTGVIACITPNIIRPEIDQYLREEDDGRTTQSLAVGTIVGRSKVYGVSVTQGGSPQEPQLTGAQRLLQSMTGRPHLEMAVSLWGDRVRTWPRLYRIMEDLARHVGRPLDKAGMCSKPDLERFTCSANSVLFAGRDSRHAANQKQKPPSAAKGMSLDEAIELIGHMLEKALRLEATRQRTAVSSRP